MIQRNRREITFKVNLQRARVHKGHLTIIKNC